MAAWYNEIDRDLTGRRFGQWTVEREVSGGADKHRRWACICLCGEAAVVRGSSLRSGKSVSCRSCSYARARAEGRLSRRRGEPGDAAFALMLDTYRRNAARRGLVFDLAADQVRSLIAQDCRYCGASPSEGWRTRHGDTLVCNGIDRRENAQGYTPENSVPCCPLCNYAKRELSEADFIAWAARVAKHNGGAA